MLADASRARSPSEQIALLETFADQAVIAIENARLFEELEERNRELSAGAGAADRAGEVLRVIASSPTDLQDGPDDDRSRRAARLCRRRRAACVYEVDGR